MISQLLLYSLKASLILSLCYVPYTLILHRERFFRLNRAVLLGIMVLSLVLPAFNISSLSLDNLPVMQATCQQMAEMGLPVQSVDIEAMPQAVTEKQPTGARWFDIIAIVFFVGMVFSIFFRCIQMGVLSYILNRQNVWTKRQEDGILVCCRKGNFSPYSWIHRIVISENDWDENARTILLHETGHIKSKHSYDQMLLLLCQAVMWYNPFAWMLGHSLADVHEYEADDYVLRQGVDAKSYMMLLVCKVAKWEGYSFVNSLNHSTLNKRIIMMKEGPVLTPWRKSKILYLLPVCALGLSVFATPKVSEPTQKVLLELEQAQNPAPIHPDVPPSYGKDDNAFNLYMSQHLKYPPLALEYGIQGCVWAEVQVNPDGSLSDIRTSRSEEVGREATAEVIDGISAVAFSPSKPTDEPEIERRAFRELCKEVERLLEETSGQWTPGYMLNEDGTQTPVAVRLAFPIHFRLS